MRVVRTMKRRAPSSRTASNSCHNVVDNYRAMLTGEVTADAAEETPPDAEIDLPA